MGRFVALCWGLKALLVAALAGSIGGPQAAAQDDLPADPADAAAWEAARTIGTEAACQGYLDQYPTGRYAEEAFRCIIEAALPPAGPVTPPSVGRRRPPPVPDDSGDDGCGDRGAGECTVRVVPEARPVDLY